MRKKFGVHLGGPKETLKLYFHIKITNIFAGAQKGL